MLFSHVACAVESFRVDSDRPGAFGDELHLEGWFLSEVAVRRMEVRYPDGRALEVVDRQRESDVLMDHYGDAFGERARRSRFLLVEPLGPDRWDHRAAVFHVETEEGGTICWPLGPLFEEARPSGFSAAESELVMGFESVGENCEFGLVQRLVGVERLSFLRYAGVGDVFALADGIAGGLTVFDGDGAVVMTEYGNEWIANVPGLGLAFHTGRSTGAISREQIVAAETRKLAFMAQKFIEDCETSAKVFVYRVHRDERGGPEGTRGMNAMCAALRCHGPATLFWVNEADAGHEAGTVVRVRDGLYRGWIDHLAPAWDAFDHRPRSWLDLLGRLRALMR